VGGFSSRISWSGQLTSKVFEELADIDLGGCGLANAKRSGDPKMLLWSTDRASTNSAPAPRLSVPNLELAQL
jgi:hypothetical protein